jgi:hypothetical protein
MAIAKKNKRVFTFEIPKNPKEALEKALHYSLFIAYHEKRVLGKKYTEENLRYTVMLVISDLDHFGTYPNKSDAYLHLCFQHQYTHEGLTKKESKLIPDIVCLRKLEKRNYYSRNHPLVIELKKDGKIAPSKKSMTHDLSKRINKFGSCIESDILKTRIYLSKGKDSDTFETGVVLNLLTECNEAEFIWLEKMLIRQQKEFLKVNSKESHKNLLFAWFNPLIGEPELIWLNQKAEISLRKK